MKKSKWYVVALGIMVLAIFTFVGWYFTKGSQQKSENADTRNPVVSVPITDDYQYDVAVASVTEQYMEATIKTMAILSTDLENTDIELWQTWIEQNDSQWDAVDLETQRIIVYLDSENINPAESNPYISKLLESFYVSAALDAPDGESKNTTSQMPTKYHDFTKSDIQEDIYWMVEYGSHKETMKYVMEKYQKDARIARGIIEEVQILQTAQSLDVAERSKIMQEGAEKIRDGSFFTVQVGSIVISGGALATTGSLAAKAYNVANITFNGAEVTTVLMKNGAILLDQNGATTRLKLTEEQLKEVTNVMSYVDAVDPTKPGSWLTYYNLANALDKKLKGDNPTEDTFLQIERDENENISLYSGAKGEGFDLGDGEFSDFVKDRFPKNGTYIINGRVYHGMEEVVEALENTPTPPTELSGTYSYSYTQTVNTPLGPLVNDMKLTVTITDDNQLSGRAISASNPYSITVNGVKVTTTSSSETDMSDFNSQLPDSILLSGTGTAISTVTSNKAPNQTTKEPITVSFNGGFEGEKLVGNISFTVYGETYKSNITLVKE